MQSAPSHRQISSIMHTEETREDKEEMGNEEKVKLKRHSGFIGLRLHWNPGQLSNHLTHVCVCTLIGYRKRGGRVQHDLHGHEKLPESVIAFVFLPD